jgi:hypothetical protein
MGQRGRHQADQCGDGWLRSCPGRGAAFFMPLRRDRNERRCLVRSRFCEATLRKGYALHRARDTRSVIQISNSQTLSFSRRNASEVCQSLANRARGWSGGRRQDAQWDTLEAGGEPTSRGKAPRAPKARRSASQRSTGHQFIDRSGAPRSGQLSLRPMKDRV